MAVVVTGESLLEYRDGSQRAAQFGPAAPAHDLEFSLVDPRDPVGLGGAVGRAEGFLGRHQCGLCVSGEAGHRAGPGAPLMKERADAGWGVGPQRCAGAGGDPQSRGAVAVDGLVGEEGERVCGEIGVAGLDRGRVALLVEAGGIGFATAVERGPSGLLGLFGEYGQQPAPGGLRVAAITQKSLRGLDLAEVHAVRVAAAEDIVEATQARGALPQHVGEVLADPLPGDRLDQVLHGNRQAGSGRRLQERSAPHV